MAPALQPGCPQHRSPSWDVFTLYAAVFDGYLMALPCPWSPLPPRLHFYSLHNGISQPLDLPKTSHGVFSITFCWASLAVRSNGGRIHEPFSPASFMPLKVVLCRKYCPAMLAAWDESFPSWIPLAETVLLTWQGGLLTCEHLFLYWHAERPLQKGTNLNSSSTCFGCNIKFPGALFLFKLYFLFFWAPFFFLHFRPA